MNVRQLRDLLKNVPDEAEVAVDVGDGLYKGLKPVWVAPMKRLDHATFEEIPLGDDLRNYPNAVQVWVLE